MTVEAHLIEQRLDRAIGCRFKQVRTEATEGVQHRQDGGSCRWDKLVDRRDARQRELALYDESGLLKLTQPPSGSWYPQGDSNPCFHLERVASWSPGRWGRR